MIAAILPWVNKNTLMILAIVGLCGLAVAGYKIHETKKIAAAVEATKAKISADAVAAVTKTAEAEREAFDTTPLPPSKPAIIDLCKRSASCRERSTLK